MMKLFLSVAASILVLMGAYEGGSYLLRETVIFLLEPVGRGFRPLAPFAQKLTDNPEKRKWRKQE